MLSGRTKCNILAGPKGSKEVTHEKRSYDMKSHGTSEENKNARTYWGGVVLEVGGRASRMEKSQIMIGFLTWLGFWTLVNV